jgi:hypothetical protein
MNQLISLITDESKWLPVSMGLALTAVVVLVLRGQNPELPIKRRILALMNLFFGVTILTMACGHFLAVTTKLAIGTLQGSGLKLYAIGIALIVPTLCLVLQTQQILTPNEEHGRKTVLLNLWLGVTLLILGIHNLPIALPALINIGYHVHSRKVIGFVILSVSVLVNVGLFVGSVIFMFSGQSFEQFTGMG